MQVGLANRNLGILKNSAKTISEVGANELSSHPPCMSNKMKWWSQKVFKLLVDVAQAKALKHPNLQEIACSGTAANSFELLDHG